MDETQGRTQGVWLFRHGELEPNPDHRFVGQRDLRLSSHGRVRYEALAKRFAAQFVDKDKQELPQAFFCSDLARAIECADILRRAFQPKGGCMPVIADPGFREISLGAWEGLTKAEVEARYPGALAERAADFANYAPLGGESFSMLQQRALMAMVRARLHTPKGNFVVVAHAAFNRCLIGNYLALPLAEVMRIPQDYACVQYLENY